MFSLMGSSLTSFLIMSVLLMISASARMVYELGE